MFESLAVLLLIVLIGMGIFVVAVLSTALTVVFIAERKKPMDGQHRALAPVQESKHIPYAIPVEDPFEVN